MPRMIKNGGIVEEAGNEILTLDQWLAAEDKAQAVGLEPGEGPFPLLEHLDSIPLVAINFPNFMDGRGFSYARELRERGYRGELRATGHFIRDQLTAAASMPLHRLTNHSSRTVFPVSRISAKLTRLHRINHCRCFVVGSGVDHSYLRRACLNSRGWTVLPSLFPSF